MAMIDLRTHERAARGAVPAVVVGGARDDAQPAKLAGDGRHLDLWAAPDNGEEANGTEVFHYTATVAR